MEFLPPAMKLGQGYVFTHVCDSVHRGGLPQCMLGYTAWEQTPKTRHPPQSSACWEIQATSGWYASYWNAYLFWNVFTQFAEFSNKKYLSLKGLEPATSCVRDQDSTTAPAIHMSETETLNWAQFVLQRFIRFTEFADITEFNELSAPIRKNSNDRSRLCQVEVVTGCPSRLIDDLER